jgi:hypothetical protein
MHKLNLILRGFIAGFVIGGIAGPPGSLLAAFLGVFLLARNKSAPRISGVIEKNIISQSDNRFSVFSKIFPSLFSKESAAFGHENLFYLAIIIIILLQTNYLMSDVRIVNQDVRVDIPIYKRKAIYFTMQDKLMNNPSNKPICLNEESKFWGNCFTGVNSKDGNKYADPLSSNTRQYGLHHRKKGERYIGRFRDDKFHIR